MTPAALLHDCSFEIAARGHARLLGVQSRIPKGTVISIAFLPADTVPILVEAATFVRRLGFIPKPHIAARRLSSHMELAHLLSRFRTEAGVDRAFVIGGDSPSPSGPYSDALSVINTGLFAEYGFKRIGIAGYPDGHPHISSDMLWSALAAKLAALRQQRLDVELVTQFSFDPAAIVRWLGQVRSHGVDAEVRIGIPGPATVKSLLHWAARCGVRASAAALVEYGGSLARLLGSATPDRLLRELAAAINAGSENRVHLHFHPFGGLDKAVQWVRESAAPKS